MKKLIFIILIFNISFSYSQIYNLNLTGNIHTDLNLINNKYQLNGNFLNFDSNEKSPILASVLSAAVPGAGQFYSESYIKSALFLLIEGALWYTNFYYNKKGDDQTIYFQNYADANWSVVKYAQWLNEYGQQLGATEPIFININPNTELKPWQRVNWDELNSAESKIKEFSHKLYPYGEQQYYEMIGKYQQFGPGWAEYNAGKDYYNNPPEQMKKYSAERGLANDYYNYADKAFIVIIINHLASAIDAYLTANGYNSDLKTNATLERINNGFAIEYYPKINFKLRL